MFALLIWSWAHAIVPAPGVLTVDDTPGAGAQYATIQDAVDAAADGDTIRIAFGSYASFVVDGKDLVLTTDGSPVTVTGTSRVRNVAAGKQVLLRGIELTATGAEALIVEQVGGRVWIEECWATSKKPTTGSAVGKPGLVLDQVSDTRVLRSFVLGGDGTSGQVPRNGGPGLLAKSSRVAAYDCTLQGGGGGHAAPYGLVLDGGDGGHGIVLESSWMRAHGTTFRGGDGGYADFCDCPGDLYCGDPGTGGSSITGSLPPGLASVEILGATLLPGKKGSSGGIAWGYPCWEGVDGQWFSGLAPQDVTVITGPHRKFWTESPVVDGQSASLFVQAQPGDVALIALGVPFGPASVTGLLGGLYLGPPYLFVHAGPWSPALMPLSLPVPPQPAGFESLRVYSQGVVLTPGGEIRLLAPASLIVIDDAI